MELRQLQYFVRIAELGSLSKASAFLKIAQPALSRQIKNLEIEYSEPLFIRNGRGVELTDAGKRLFHHAQGILELTERAYEDMENARTNKSGRVTIGMPPVLARTMATPLVQKLWSALPDVRVTILRNRSTQLQEWLLSGIVDMALMLDAPASPMLEIHQVSAEKLAMVGSAEMLTDENDITLTEVADFPLILPSRPNKVRTLIESELEKIGRYPNILLECDLMDTALELVATNRGCSIHSERFGERASGTGGLRFRKIAPPILLKFHVALPSRRPISRLQDEAFKVFKSGCEDYFRSMPA